MFSASLKMNRLVSFPCSLTFILNMLIFSLLHLYAFTHLIDGVGVIIFSDCPCLCMRTYILASVHAFECRHFFDWLAIDFYLFLFIIYLLL